MRPLNLRIEQEIERSIRSREYSAGQKLPTENEYCAKFSASRTVVREALKSLNSKGLVDIKKGSGIYVTQLSTKGAIDMLNFYFEMSQDKDLVYNTIKARQYFEPEIAAQAAMRRTDSNLHDLKISLDKLIACPLENVELETELDREFHSLVTDSAANPVVKIIMEPIFNLIPKHNKTVYGKDGPISDSDRRDATVKFHKGIYEAIEQKDSREAYYQMKQSLLKTEKNHLALMDFLKKNNTNLQ
ncbi:FadR/GntR family transcriptional regulator [Reichenbachiella sp. MALMAid0571]|uniref:FadR/GntR family transcriptional regulator n=1 Tax=Reichenbachiella sp. MALMAid0571 TaxID=3143939 RepID=UPI0032DEA141